jgi:hypothetical protein
MPWDRKNAQPVVDVGETQSRDPASEDDSKCERHWACEWQAFGSAEEPVAQCDVGSALHQRFGYSLEVRRGVLPIRVQGSDDLSTLAERINYARLEGRALPEIDRMTEDDGPGRQG